MTDVFHRNSFAMAISRDMAIDLGLVEPTAEEEARRSAELAAFREREAVRRAEPGPEVTVEALLHWLGWSAEYAAHALHPACSCTPLADDPYLCSWAVELGFTHSWDTGRIE